MLKRLLNLDLLEFHVREAAQELDLLLDAIQYAQDGMCGTDDSRRCRKRMRSSTGMRSSRVRVTPEIGSRSSGRRNPDSHIAFFGLSDGMGHGIIMP